MPPAASTTARRNTMAGLGLLFPGLLCAAVLVIIVPLPALVLDLLLAANLAAAVLILLTTVYVRRPLEFSVFPTLLLATTLARLVLNVASTRLVLSRGPIDGDMAAGGVIRAFGDFVAGGEIAIGLIMFGIILAIQFLVITKGATRISEVAARFTLDGLPGRQMAIDAELNAGLITLEQARQRRDQIHQQADFYGAMDGASKFIRGDAIAGLVITGINIVGGLYLGIIQHGMPIAQAFDVFTRLTIGDGLVSQVPAFLISLAAGLIVTRSSHESELSQDVVTQTFGQPAALAVSAVFLLGLACTGLPTLPLIALASACGWFAWMGFADRAAQVANAAPAPAVAKPAGFDDQLTIYPLELEIGYGLIRMTDPAHNGDLLERLNRVRQKLATELGMIVPSVRIADNLRLKSHQYRIKLHGIPIASGDAYADRCLAINTDTVSGDLPGIHALDPAFQRPAIWIEPGEREQAVEFGYHVVDPAPVIATHLTEVVRRHADELLSQQQVHQLLERLRTHSPRLVDEVIPQTIKVPQLQQLLISLLRERVSIRNLETILETLAKQFQPAQDLEQLTETVRLGLRRSICQQYRSATGILRVITLAPDTEAWLMERIDRTPTANTLVLPPHLFETLVQAIDQEAARLLMLGASPVLLCRSGLRGPLQRLLANSLPQLAVLSLPEITPDTRLELHAQIPLAPAPHPPTPQAPTFTGLLA